jgi:hypothetical protein
LVFAFSQSRSTSLQTHAARHQQAISFLHLEIHFILIELNKWSLVVSSASSVVHAVSNLISASICVCVGGGGEGAEVERGQWMAVWIALQAS